MATIPSNTKFIGYSDSIDFTERKTSSLNNLTEVYSMADIAASAGISGDMVAMASASGTPTENGQSIIDAYEKVKGKHVHVEAEEAPGTGFMGSVSSLTLGHNIWPAGMSGPAGEITVQVMTNPPNVGRKYKGTFPLVGGGTTDLYFILLKWNPATNVGLYYYCTEDNETTDGEGFFKDATGTAYDKQGMTMFPYPSFPNIDLSGSPMITFTEITTVKPVVLIPPGNYEMPSNFAINHPVDFKGMDMTSTILSTGYNRNITINYGHCYQFDYMTRQNLLGDIPELVDQAITFSNLTINVGTFSNDIGAYMGEYQGISSGIVFNECVLNGGVSNLLAVPFGFVKYASCELPANHKSFYNLMGGHVTVSDCLFRGYDEPTNFGAFFSREVIFGTDGQGFQQVSTVILDSNQGKGLSYQMTTDYNADGMELIARRTVFNRLRQTGSGATYTNYLGETKGANVISYCESTNGVATTVSGNKIFNYNVNIT